MSERQGPRAVPGRLRRIALVVLLSIYAILFVGIVVVLSIRYLPRGIPGAVAVVCGVGALWLYSQRRTGTTNEGNFVSPQSSPVVRILVTVAVTTLAFTIGIAVPYVWYWAMTTNSIGAASKLEQGLAAILLAPMIGAFPALAAFVLQPTRRTGLLLTVCALSGPLLFGIHWILLG